MDGFQNNALITIGEIRMPVIEYRNRRVVTFAMMDQVHQRPEGTARKRFHDHRDKLVEGEDYFRLSYQEVASLSEIRTAGIQPNSQGMVVLTQSGYLMLVKSFTDNLAWEVQRQLVLNYFTPQSKARQLLFMAQMMLEQEERVSRLEQAKNDQQKRIDAIARRQDDMDGDTGYMTALGFCRRVEIPAPLEFAQRLGIKASNMCKRLKIRTGKVPDERWGSVKSYPESVLQECLTAMRKPEEAI